LFAADEKLVLPIAFIDCMTPDPPSWNPLLPLRHWLTLVLLIATLGLSGCVRYDVGIHYDGQFHGEIVQQVKVGQSLTNLSDATPRAWLSAIERQTKQLGGRVQRLSDQELRLTIPFNNGKELQTKFNQLYHLSPAQSEPDDDGLDPITDRRPAVPDIQSTLKIKENNWVVLLRTHLSYEVDLRSLGLLSSEGRLLVGPGSLLNLEFRLVTPWGARAVDAADVLNPQVAGRELIWTLQAGAVNQLEAIFWMPSPLGIGAVAIALFVLVGSGLKALLERRRQPQAALSTEP
jgi:Protein of unknown function (DUF3153)